ncbi:hypothetical protein VTK26DRAFT_4760 [Humicola hyalothermophila]
MGGSAFSSLPNPPYTPRMPPAIYRRVASACQAALRELFIYVATPIEGPEKKDYGDVDILVALERSFVFPKNHDTTQRSPHDLMRAILQRLSAEYAIVHPTGTSANLAVKWPPEELSELERAANGQQESKDKYIQVDVRICPDPDQLCWTLFKHAHGDLWNLLGSTIRPFGLTVDEEALWIRIPEIERIDRKKAKVRLTRDPVEVLHFLGMKVEGFWTEPFESVDALFEYVTTCRLFWVHDVPPKGELEGDVNEVGVMGGEAGRRRLGSNDRRRMKGRPVFRRWINEFIPRLRAQGKFMLTDSEISVHHIRETVRDEAFASFHVEAEYKTRLKEWRLKREAEEMKGLLKELTPATLDPQIRACVVSALKKVVMEDDHSFGVTPSDPLKDDEGFYKIAAVYDFVRDNWEQIRDVAWERQKQRAREAAVRRAASKVNEAGESNGEEAKAG